MTEAHSLRWRDALPKEATDRVREASARVPDVACIFPEQFHVGRRGVQREEIRFALHHQFVGIHGLPAVFRPSILQENRLEKIHEAFGGMDLSGVDDPLYDFDPFWLKRQVFHEGFGLLVRRVEREEMIQVLLDDAQMILKRSRA